MHALPRLLIAIIVTFVGGMSALPSSAQTFPSKPITLICPWPVGGASDLVLRAFGEAMSKQLNQQVVIENRPGASGTLGAVAMTNARADGYTLAQIPQGAFRIPHMQKVSYDIVTERGKQAAGNLRSA